MTDRYTIDRADGITTIRFLKRLNIEDILAAVDEFATNPSKLRVWVIDNVFELSSSEFLGLAEYAASKDLPAGKSAIVGPVDPTCGIGRIYGSYFRKTYTQMKMFRTFEEAIDWLKSE